MLILTSIAGLDDFQFIVRVNYLMKITDESKVFYHSVYAVIGKIPPGKVTSYGT